jgi:hypothetical protein
LNRQARRRKTFGILRRQSRKLRCGGDGRGFPAVPLRDEIETAKGSHGRPVLRALQREPWLAPRFVVREESQIGLMA